jgi:CRISPR-associated protein Cmr3
MTTMLEITCRDPIVARDGRPFGADQGTRMRSAPWPLPSAVVGSLRSAIGKRVDPGFSPATVQELLQIEIAGLFPVADGELYLPSPHDCVFHPDHGALRARPHAVASGGCDLPTVGLLPVGLVDAPAETDFKPSPVPAWWPATQVATWLVGTGVSFNDRFLAAPSAEPRTHVRIDPASGAAKEHQLFTTEALPLSHLPRFKKREQAGLASRFAEIVLAARIRAGEQLRGTVAALDDLHPLGGERRLVRWRATGDAARWRCPPEVASALASTTHVRMVLATPAVFAGGWKPGWLNGELIGTPPGSVVELRLVGVSIERWQAVSGWSLATLPGKRPGPKPVKRVVPAGGVYFFETTDGAARDLTDRWLEPVSDDAQDQRDGFGLAIWGTW